MSEISPGSIPEGYLSNEQTCRLLHISANTFRTWASEGRIKFWRSGGKRRYNVREFVFRNSTEPIESNKPVTPTRKTICYARVSTRSQKDDLQR
jgi:excisionase family DNA binding protein